MTDFKKAFIDTAPFIYFLEQNPEYFEKAKNFFCNSYMQKKLLATSVITIEEYCVYPCRTGKKILTVNFFNAIDTLKMQIFNIDNDIAYKAAQIRAEYKDFKAMDSLQLAAAAVNKCDIFLTNDKQLRQFKEIKCLTLDDIYI